jgi:hypothetical protein
MQLFQDVSAYTGFLLRKAAMLTDMTKDSQRERERERKRERDMHIHAQTYTLLWHKIKSNSNLV